MGRRGPPPTPKAILALRGSWRAKENAGQPIVTPGRPSCPKHLTGDTRKAFAATAQILDRMGVLAKHEGVPLERYAVALVAWRAAIAFLATNGTTYPIKSTGIIRRDKGGEVIATDPPPSYIGRLGKDADGNQEYLVAWGEHHQVRQRDRLAEELRKMEGRFGLTPADRTRVQMIAFEDAEAGPGVIPARARPAVPRLEHKLPATPSPAGEPE